MTIPDDELHDGHVEGGRLAQDDAPVDADGLLIARSSGAPSRVLETDIPSLPKWVISLALFAGILMGVGMRAFGPDDAQAPGLFVIIFASTMLVLAVSIPATRYVFYRDRLVVHFGVLGFYGIGPRWTFMGTDFTGLVSSHDPSQDQPMCALPCGVPLRGVYFVVCERRQGAAAVFCPEDPQLFVQLFNVITSDSEPTELADVV